MTHIWRSQFFFFCLLSVDSDLIGHQDTGQILVFSWKLKSEEKNNKTNSSIVCVPNDLIFNLRSNISMPEKDFNWKLLPTRILTTHNECTHTHIYYIYLLSLCVQLAEPNDYRRKFTLIPFDNRISTQKHVMWTHSLCFRSQNFIYFFSHFFCFNS